MYLVGPEPTGAEVPATTCQVPFPLATKFSPGGSAAEDRFWKVPPGTGPVDPVGAALIGAAPGGAAPAGVVTGVETVGAAVTVLVLVTPLITVMIADDAPVLTPALDADGRPTCRTTSTVRAIKAGMAKARHP